MSLPASPAVRGDFSDASLRLRRIGAALLPLLVLLAWTAIVRLPFYEQTDKDEFFFMVIAREWLQGGLPYVATFDIKPPGVFFIFAVAQFFFGASQATIKGTEIVAIALGAFALYRLLRAHGSERAAVWAAALFPVYSLTFGGTVAANMVLQLPFLIAAFAALFGVLDDRCSVRQRLTWSFGAGLAIGAAGMVKQTAIFEAAAIFVALAVWTDRRLLWRMIVLYAAGAALPALGFALYFLAAGHFGEMFNAVVVLAQGRTGRDVLALYGPKLAYYFTPGGVLLNTMLSCAPVIFLWGAVLFLVLRLAEVRRSFPGRTLAIAALWVAAALAGVIVGLDLNDYYMMATVPPLLILASALFAHGLRVAASRQIHAAVAAALVAVVSVAYVDHRNLFTPNRFLAGDYDATREVGAKIRALHPGENDRLLVLNRGLAVFDETGLLPPAPYFHPTQLLGLIHTPVADPLAVALNANPRFIVIADPGVWHITEQPSRIQEALAYVGAHYRVAAQVDGAKDSFTLYEYAGS